MAGEHSCSIMGGVMNSSNVRGNSMLQWSAQVL